MSNAIRNLCIFMRFILIAVLSVFFNLVVLATLPAYAASLSVGNCDFGEMHQFERTACRIPVRNSGTRAVRLTKISVLNNSDTVEPSSYVLAPGQEVVLALSVASVATSGVISRIVRIETDNEETPYVNAYAYGFVLGFLNDLETHIDYGDVVVAGELPQRKVAILDIGGNALRITNVLDVPKFISFAVSPDGLSLNLSIKPSIDWGRHSNEKILLSLGSTVQSKAQISVSINAIGDISPAKNPFPLGIIRNDRSRDFYIPLTSKSGKGFHPGSVALNGMVGTAEIIDCDPVSVNCKRVRLSLGSELPIGPVYGKVTIDFPEQRRRLAIDLTGVALSLGIEPAHVPESVTPEVVKDGGHMVSRHQEVNIRGALRSSIKQASTAPPVGHGPLLKWAVANESKVYGYLVLRSQVESGPFEVVSKDSIRAETFEPGVANSYQWRDLLSKVGETYWYEIFLLYKDGTKERLTSPQKVIAK